MNVLLVEDDDGVREVMSDLLADSARVRATNNVPEGLHALATDPFELVFADLRIRGAVDGGKQILNACRQRLVPVVIVTGLQREELQRTLDGLNPDAVLLKPFPIEDALALSHRFGKLWREVTALSEAAFAPVWQPYSDGVRIHVLEGDALSGKRWIGVNPGSRGKQLSYPLAQAGRVTEGQLTINGMSVPAGRSFFLPTGYAHEIASEQGGTAVLVSVPNPA